MMGKQNEFKPDYRVSPGDVLLALMEQEDWMVHHLADEMGLSSSELVRILAGIAPVTKQVAEELAKGFSLPAKVWLMLEQAYREGQGQQMKG